MLKFLVPVVLLASALAAMPCDSRQQPPPDQPPPHEVPPHEAHHPPGVQHPPGEHGQPNDGRPPGAPPAPIEVVPMKTGAGNAWFERTQLFMGEFKDTELVKGTFPFKNPHAEEHRFTKLEAHCQCAKALIHLPNRLYVLETGPKGRVLSEVRTVDGKEVKSPVKFVPVAAGESGTLEVHMSLGKFQGIKESSMQFESSDKSMPLVHIKWQAKGIRYFIVSPGDFFLNDVQYGQQKTFKFEVSSDVKPDFKLLEHEKVPSYVTVEKKQVTLANGKPGWEVSGTFGPKAPAGSGGAAIKFKTDLEGREVSMNVVANVQGPVQIAPGTFISLGRVAKGVGTSKQVTITPSGDLDLSMKSYRFENLTIDKKYLKVEASRRGPDLVIELTVLPEVQGRVVMRGEVFVTTNVQEVGELKFNFNGLLR